MALAATMNWEVRTTGLDTNGGGFDPTSGVPGTDYSQQDSPQVAYTDLVIDATTNTKCTSAGTPFTAAHVGNLMNVTGGTGFTVQRVQIMSVAAGVATCDKSLGTLSSTGGVANLGGGLATWGGLGLALSLVGVAGQVAWVKYHASNVYSVTSTTANVANGRLSVSLGSTSLPFSLIGYDATHGDNTGNRPTVRWGTSAAANALFGLSGVHLVKNFIFDGNRANFSLGKAAGISSTGLIDNCKFLSFTAGALTYTTGSHILSNCEFTDNITSAALQVTTAGQEMNIYNCYVHDNLQDGFSINQTARFIINGCIFDTNTGSHIICSNTGTSDSPNITNCTFYNSSSHAINLAGSCVCFFENNVFDSGSGTGYAVNTSLAGPQYGLIFRRNAFNLFTSGAYDSTKVLARNVIDEVTQSAGTWFVDGANQNFTLNTTAGQGALIRGIAYTHPGSPNASYRDYGAIQHQDSGGSTLAGTEDVWMNQIGGINQTVQQIRLFIGTSDLTPVFTVAEDSEWQKVIVPVIGKVQKLYPDFVDDLFTTASIAGQPVDEYWQSKVAPVMNRVQKLYPDFVEEVISAVAVAGQPEEDYWNVMVAPVAAQMRQKYPFADTDVIAQAVVQVIRGRLYAGSLQPNLLVDTLKPGLMTGSLQPNLLAETIQ